jgi:hypothetical protein
MLVLVFATLAAPAAAQRRRPSASEPGDWRHCTILSAVGGVATDSSDPGGVAGGAVGWEIFPRLSVEGGALWVNDAAGADGFNAAVKVRAGFRQTGVSPFVEGGFGLYRVSTTNGPDAMPPFYAHRMMATGGTMRTQSFTDPAFHLGAGINVFASRHIALQPAVEAMIVPADSQTYTVTMITMRLTYHFEDHRVR